MRAAALDTASAGGGRDDRRGPAAPGDRRVSALRRSPRGQQRAPLQPDILFAMKPEWRPGQVSQEERIPAFWSSCCWRRSLLRPLSPTSSTLTMRVPPQAPLVALPAALRTGLFGPSCGQNARLPRLAVGVGRRRQRGGRRSAHPCFIGVLSRRSRQVDG
jgi:hypothetical protein